MDDVQRQALERFRALIANPQSAITDVDDAYLRLEGEQLWLDAKERYHEHGRGAMMVDMRDVSSGAIDSYYLPESLLLADMTTTEEPLRHALANYNPNQEALIVIWHRHGSSFYRIGSEE